MREVVIATLAVTSLTLFGLGYLGRWHPAGDSLALVRVPCALLAVIFMIFTSWHFRLRIALALITIAPVVAIGHNAIFPQPKILASTALTLYQKNVLGGLRDFEALITDLRDVQPHFVTLQETGAAYSKIKEGLADLLPVTFSCITYQRATAVLSKWPVVEASQTCLGNDRLGAAGFQVETPQGRVWVVSLHLFWPWPDPQQLQLRSLWEELEKLEGPVILAGDFNMVPWGYSVKAVERATGTRRVGALKATRFKGMIPVPIDLVLASGRGRIETRPFLGSDHLGVLAEIELER